MIETEKAELLPLNCGRLRFTPPVTMTIARDCWWNYNTPGRSKLKQRKAGQERPEQLFRQRLFAQRMWRLSGLHKQVPIIRRGNVRDKITTHN